MTQLLGAIKWREARITISLLILPCIPANAQVIAVRVCNFSTADARDVTEMTRIAGAVFRHSGIAIRWLECSPGAADRNVILLSLVNKSAQVGAHTLGWTTLGTSELTILFSDARNVSMAVGLVTPGRIMGYSAAHELGHAFLRSGEHALFGVLKAQYTRRDLVQMSQETLFFTAEQTKLLQSEIRAR
jgi:hypothetical protein